MAKLLIVEDDVPLGKTIRDWLVFDGHRVETSTDGQDALEMLRSYHYDLVILDWELPRLSGLEVLKEYRMSGGKAPVLMLTGRVKLDHKVEGFDAGADDYVTKPFQMKELSARVRAMLKRPADLLPSTMRAGDLELNSRTFTVSRQGLSVQLGPQEFALLEFLVKNPNVPFKADALLDRVWPSRSDASPATIRTHVKTLRQKLDIPGQPSVIRNLHGIGYLFAPSPVSVHSYREVGGDES